jgi:hypothetical protein
MSFPAFASKNFLSRRGCHLFAHGLVPGAWRPLHKFRNGAAITPRFRSMDAYVRGASVSDVGVQPTRHRFGKLLRSRPLPAVADGGACCLPVGEGIEPMGRDLGTVEKQLPGFSYEPEALVLKLRSLGCGAATANSDGRKPNASRFSGTAQAVRSFESSTLFTGRLGPYRYPGNS